MPSLADALAIGLIVLVVPAAQSTIVLRYREAALTAVGRDTAGVEVTTPRLNLDRVTHLEVHDVTVGQVSARPLGLLSEQVDPSTSALTGA
jgi:hypothetical protein